MVWGGHGPEISPWSQACIEGLVSIVKHSKHSSLRGMVDAVGFVDAVRKYSSHSRQFRHSLAWDNQTLTILCLLEEPVLHFVYIAFTIK